MRLEQKRHFHTAFIGDTGFGKSVAAVRLALETTGKWRLRTIVLDFGAGWRQLLNGPELHEHVEIRQLSPVACGLCAGIPCRSDAISCPKCSGDLSATFSAPSPAWAYAGRSRNCGKPCARSICKQACWWTIPNCQASGRCAVGEEGIADTEVASPLRTWMPMPDSGWRWNARKRWD